MSPLEGVAALRPLDKLGDLTPVGEPVEPQGPWDLWLAKESGGETSPTKIIFGKLRGPIDNL